tara:strand:- start:758 stop:2518 length:1761 start_codon:yes stop_codon:yes gene_type:complete
VIMIRFACLLALGWLLAHTALARPQGPEARAHVELSAGLVKLGGEVRMDIVVQDASRAEVLEIPPIEGIDVLGPGTPTISRFREFVGGRWIVQSTLRWPVVLRPTRTGTFQIAGIRMSIDGKERTLTVSPGELEVVRDIEGAAVSYIEWVGLPDVVYEGQPIDLDLRFGWDAGLNPSAIDLRIPWWGHLPDTLSIPGAPRDGAATWRTIQVRRGRTLLELRSEIGADFQRGDRPFTSNRITDRIVQTRPGKLVIPQIVFQFRVPSARPARGQPQGDVFYALLDPVEIDVRKVPEEGRPFEWTGAVGEIGVTREVDKRDVDQGDSIRFTVTWTGKANLEFFDLPEIDRLDAFRGFRLLGVQDERNHQRGEVERRVTFDLVPLESTLTEVPPLPLSYFDTVKGKYAVIATEPVPIRVRAVEGATIEGLDPTSRLEDDILGIDPTPNEGEREGPGGLALLGLLASPFLWWLGRTAARRHGDPAAPATRRRRAAGKRLAQDLVRARTAREQQRALTTFLSSRTGEGPGAWEGRDPELWRKSVDAHLSEGPARELHQLLEELDSAVYSRGDQAIDPSRIRSVADAALQGGL